MAKDADYNRMIHSARWLRLRKATLSARPYCQRCAAEGRATPASEVHHIRPVEEARTFAEKAVRMFSPANLMPLCGSCHAKAHTEMGRTGKAAARRINGEKVRAFEQRFYGEKSDRGAVFLEGEGPL